MLSIIDMLIKEKNGNIKCLKPQKANYVRQKQEQETRATNGTQ